MVPKKGEKGSIVSNYLVTCRIRLDRLDELEERLHSGRFEDFPGFTGELVYSLKHALMFTDFIAVWEEDIPVDPHRREERNAAVDEFFSLHTMREIGQDSGWELLREFPRLFPDFAEAKF